MTEIGKIDKPEVNQYKNKKRIYFIRNLYLPQNASEKYTSIFNRYWKEVKEHLTKLETGGNVKKIFCESIYMTGEESMNVLSTMNSQLQQIVKKKIDEGAELLPLEDRDIFGAYIDWNNCLMIVQAPRVYEMVQEFLKKAIEERLRHMVKTLSKEISEGEVALLIMREDDRKSMELPDDIELFPITPPAYDDLHQYIRDIHSAKEYWRT